LIAGAALGALALGFAAWKLTSGGGGGAAGQPLITLQTPSIAGGVRPVAKRQLRLAGRVANPVAGRDLEIELNGERQESPVASGQFDHELTLRANAQNEIVVRYGDADPIRFSIAHDDTQPRIKLRKPDDKARVGGAALDVEFEIEDAHPARANVAGVKAERQGSTWIAKGVPLDSNGANSLEITAFDEVDLSSKLKFTVERDGSAPQLALASSGLAPLTAGRKASFEVPFDEAPTSAKLVGERQPWWPSRDTLTVKGKSVVLELTPPEGVAQLEFEIEVLDALGNRANHSASVRVNNAPGKAWIELDGGLASGARRFTNTTSFELAGEVHNALVDHVELVVSGKARKVSLRSGRFSTSVDLAREANTEVKLRHGEAEELSLEFVHDATAPKLELVSPKSGAATRQARERVEFKITDRNLDPQSVQLAGRALQADGDVWSGDVELNADGTQRFTLAARDLAGNDAKALEFELRRDTKAPQLVPASCKPAPGSSVKTGEKLKLELVFDEPLGALQANRTTAKVTATRGELELSVPAGTGEFEVRLEFEDTLGNSGVEVLRYARGEAAVVVPTPVKPDPKPDPKPTPPPAPRASVAWAAAIDAEQPDPRIVTDAALRSAIEATGLPWRVVDGVTGARMVLIPPGEFVQDDGKRKRTVRITRAFYCGVYELTEAEWAKVMGGSGRPTRPKSGLTYALCEQFFAKANGSSADSGLRFLTEAEWEYACRAGTSGLRYGDIDQIAIYGRNETSGTPDDVGGKRKPNSFGVFDTLGNMWEWCGDWYEDWSKRAGGDAPVNDPKGPSSSKEGRVVRGGGFVSPAKDCTATRRDYDDPTKPVSPKSLLGVRIARDP
jgi:formylglycine-generating enzyme required for sulfatase activity